MMDAEKTRAWHSGDVRQAYGTRDTLLYALALGLGADPLDPARLCFTYEKDLVALPTLAAVLASPGFWMRERAELGIDYTRLVHGEQRVTLHRPLAPQGTLVGRSRVTRLVDKGEGKGALMHVEKTLHEESGGAAVATCEQVLFLRGDGGFSRAGGSRSDDPAPPLPATPEGAPERVLDIPTRPEAALLYRLCGDLNPLHADPAFAARAGFPRPILHGLATYGMACHGLLSAFCDSDPARLQSIAARLSAPVFPGETLRLEAWRAPASAGAPALAFRVRVVERDLIVLSHGHATLREEGVPRH